MILTDAGPLIALIDPTESAHVRCVEAVSALSLPLVTTWPAFAEAMYMLIRFSGDRGRESLWAFQGSGRLVVSDLTEEAVARSATLMAKYADVPMDLADATLVALAEQLGERRIFTLDSDFEIYRLHGRTRFEVLPN